MWVTHTTIYAFYNIDLINVIVQNFLRKSSWIESISNLFTPRKFHDIRVERNKEEERSERTESFPFASFETS